MIFQGRIRCRPQPGTAEGVFRNHGRTFRRARTLPTRAAAAVGWPGASQPPAPTEPCVMVSRHTALPIMSA
jgi:hypothetical protein